MKVLGVTILITFIITFVFGKFTIDHKPTNNIFIRALLSAIFAPIIGCIIGLPILGIICLIF